MTRKESGGKKYIVRLGDEERGRLNALINAGKHPARKLLKARILLKADVSVAGDGWSDARIAEALDTSTDTVLRTRQRLVEEGVDGALTSVALPPAMPVEPSATPPTNIHQARPGRASSTARPKRN